ncbi:nickel-dependent lactate racemase [Desulfosporosinus burensis]
MSSDTNVSFTVPSGTKELIAIVPVQNLIGIYNPMPLPPLDQPMVVMQKVIKDGLIKTGIAGIAAVGKKIAIGVTDRTRLTPNNEILPILLSELHALGIEDADVTIIIGTGVHTPDSKEDIEKNLGAEIADRIEVLNNRPFEKVHIELGTTSFGTPVQIHHKFADADIKIVTGNIVPCLMAGWTGGGKTVLPGIVSKETIYTNHKLFTDQLEKSGRGSMIGVLPPQNIVRADIEEAAAVAGLQMVVNTVLDEENQIVGILAGEHIEVHRDGVAVSGRSLEVTIHEKADIVVAGVGSAGFEISLYQGASRAIQALDDIIKPGGTVIVPCECREGIYEGILKQKYADWMKRMPDPEEIRALTRDDTMPPEEGVVLYAFSWLLHKLKCKMVVVTDGMTQEELRDVHMGHASTLQQAMDAALKDHGPQARVTVLPYAGKVIPKFE